MTKVNEPYEPPAIIYEGIITTRAGSRGSDDEIDVADPAELFSE